MRKNLPGLPFFFLLPLAVLFLANGCKKYDNIELADYQPEFAIPLLNTQVSVQDVLNRFDDDTYITVDENGFITMNYRGDITARTSSDIFDFIAQTEGAFPLLDTATVLPFATPNGFDLDFAVIDSGTVQFVYSCSFDEPITLTVTVPNLLTPAGEPFQYTRHHDSGLLNLAFSPIFGVEDHILKPTNDSIYVEYYVQLEDSGTREKMTGIFLDLKGFTASYVEGYMGQEIYEIPRDTIAIDFFENWTRGEVYFENPRIQVSVINSFGFPVRSKAEIMNVFAADGRVLTLQSNYLDSININYPSLMNVGGEESTLFYFDNDNSNIAEVLGSNPVAVDYEMKALANPDQDTTIRGFMTDSSRFKIQVEVELPLYGQARGFEARDTIDVDLNKYDNIRAAEFKVVAENGLPLDIGLQVYFLGPETLDAPLRVLDSLFLDSTPIIGAAPVDGEGIVTAKGELVSLIEVDNQRFEKLQEADRVILVTSFSTYDGGQTSVKIFNDQFIDVRMGMKVEVQQ